ncbi:hypothetical protein ACSSS7_002081 [Eimeria intestinalis]
MCLLPHTELNERDVFNEPADGAAPPIHVLHLLQQQEPPTHALLAPTGGDRHYIDLIYPVHKAKQQQQQQQQQQQWPASGGPVETPEATASTLAAVAATALQLLS